MPENEFEKKISSELQQLKFKPSETVWMKVEERIQKKKKRRVFIIVFLLAGIALLGYWQWNNFFGKKKSEVAQTETSTLEKNNVTDQNDQAIKKEDSLNKKKQIEEAEVKNKDENEKKETLTIVSTNKINKDNSSNIPAEKVIEKKQNSVPVDKKRAAPNIKKKISKPAQKKEVVLNDDNNLTIIAPDKPTTAKDDVKRPLEINNADQDLNKNFKPTDNKIDSAISPDIDPNRIVNSKPSIKTDSITRKDSLAKKMDSILKAVPADSPVVNLPKSSFDKKWKFGIEFIPGVSSFHESFLFSLNMNKSADAYAGPGSSNGGTVASAAPVNSRSGFAFQFGGFFKKQFTQRSSFTVGLRWAYYSEQLRIGTSMIPASQSPAFQQLLYALGATSAYDARGFDYYAINEYHFFEVPVNYNVRLNNNEAHPLNLQAGLKIGQMFTSNALVYDTAAGGIYYGSKKHFNKTQFGISTSLNWKITKKNKFYMAVGPVFDMHFNSLLDNPLDKKKYLLFTGLRTTAIFNSKK